MTIPDTERNTDDKAYRDSIRELAKRRLASDDLEIDSDAIVSLGDDNGAFVQAWVWVNFAGTPLDKREADDVP